MKKVLLITILFLFSIHNSYAGMNCKNPNRQTYINKAVVSAPLNTLGEGVKIWSYGKLIEIPDTRPECLPLPLRYNNPGALKTPSKGPWAGQIAKDKKGHAVFKSLDSGIEAWIKWMDKKLSTANNYTAMKIMSIYAPPDDCVGSIGTYPDCPKGINPTEQYATRVASSIGKGPFDVISINKLSYDEKSKLYYKIFLQIAAFEIGGDFCGRMNDQSPQLCAIDSAIFEAALKRIVGA